MATVLKNLGCPALLINVAEVRAYIANQAEHHRKRSFQQEYRSFLERHRIDYDERYVWD
jgi:hypothetical protein